MAPLFPGCDYEHWLIVMDKPGGEGATKQQMIDCYIQTLAQVVGRLVVLPESRKLLHGLGCSVEGELILANWVSVVAVRRRRRRGYTTCPASATLGSGARLMRRLPTSSKVPYFVCIASYIT
jgi:hypothetical protein